MQAILVAGCDTYTNFAPMLQQYCASLTSYRRLPTREVRIGDLAIGNGNPIRIQTMTTTDTMDTMGTVEQTIRCIEAGAELVRITAPSKKEAENLLVIKNELRARGYTTPLVADIHFTPNAAEIAARIVEKVRVNPGNYIDKKKFDIIDYTDAEYAAEVMRIRERFTPLVRICKEYGTAMRIGTNHGSLSDRIMSRYGDTPIGMVESAMEFLRIARGESYHQVVLSMKSSNPLVMVQAYRLLVQKMDEEFGECYPLHLGVTEAGDGEDGRIKSAIGIGTLLEDGIGDTIRVSLTEDPEFEIPVCRDIVRRYTGRDNEPVKQERIVLPYDPFAYQRRHTASVHNIGAAHVPVVIADHRGEPTTDPAVLEPIGYRYHAATDKWTISDAAADLIYTGDGIFGFSLPGTLQVICDHAIWHTVADKSKYHPLLSQNEYVSNGAPQDAAITFVMTDVLTPHEALAEKLKSDSSVVLVTAIEPIPSSLTRVRNYLSALMAAGVQCPVVLRTESRHSTVDEQLIHFATEAGGLLLDGLGDGIWLTNRNASLQNTKMSGRTYLEVKSNAQFLNNTAFSILQATRTRISKTEYISCPSCGRTLFDLQETTAKIRAATHHLKGVKIAIMGCIVNGPGEMADADFGYVGSGPGKITLYKGKEVVKRNVPSDIAVNELITLLKENDAWVDVPVN
ncbi:4-hydroxy-3-methylbut-2-en-1-yl diphosphate synthase [Nemorincola caseinilytica]|uniref:4-hydroxy-3-methylbut-2-en-1-yl diphosphate synthase (flavodoxin) n=1 Tax=Nemorincola caseinilytica TaxID=2054315 RepID=A0ABP8NI88_9BACT